MSLKVYQKYKGLSAIVAANVIFGLNIPVTKSLVANWLTPTGYTLTRMLLGTVVFWTIGFFLPKEKVNGKDQLFIAIGGFFGFITTQFLFALSLQYTTPVYYSLMATLTPIVVLLLSVFFLKESVTAKKITGMLISIAGAILIILQSSKSSTGTNNLLGISLALMSTTSYGVYLIVTRRISIKYKPVTVVKYMFLFACLMILPFGFSELPTQKMYSNQVTATAIMQLSFALLFSTTLALFLMPVALNRLKATTVSIYMNLQPLTASVVAIIVGQDIFSWDKPLAAVLIIAGVYLVTQSKI